MTISEDDLLKLRLNYAWKWFDFHAKQRMTLFNYFLIIAGIFANAILLSYKDDRRQGVPEAATASQALSLPTTLPGTVPNGITISQVQQVPGASVSPGNAPAPQPRFKAVRLGIAGLGALAAVGFIVFDVRSRKLTARAEDVLEHLERTSVFPDGVSLIREGTTRQLGLLRCEADETMREGQRRTFWSNAQKMKYWIWLIEASVGVAFLTSILL